MSIHTKTVPDTIPCRGLIIHIYLILFYIKLCYYKIVRPAGRID
nr:MAG TPA: hypothetical protein [Caudoviricetes sp.]